jgi:ankyrin repeat protein
LACEEERVEVVKVLLKHGADPFCKNKENKTPVDFSFGALLPLIEQQQQQQQV